MTDPAQTKLYGLIGYPVKHSLSAVMHNAAFASLQMPARYELFEVSPDCLDDFFRRTIRERGIQGFNVTIPHKENALAYLSDPLPQTVSMNHAVNTVRIEPDGRLSGLNTDGDGFLRDLRERGVSVAGKIVALLGAGGGAKAVASALCGQGIGCLRVYDANAQKSARLGEIIKTFFPKIRLEVAGSVEGLKITDADLLINATPVGMKETDPVLIDPALLREDLFVYDLIYNPVQTKLLQTAQRTGCRWANGLGMLLFQGALAWEFWTGRPAPVDVMRKALEEASCLKSS